MDTGTLAGPRRIVSIARRRSMDIATAGILVFAVWQFVARRASDASAERAHGSTALTDSMPAAIVVADSGGTEARIFETRQAQPLLVFVFRSDCPYCAQQREGWTQLAAAAQEKGIEVVALTSEPLSGGVQNYLGDAPVPIRRVSQPAALLGELGIHAVPATVLVDAANKIQFHHVGLMHEAKADELADLLQSRGRHAVAR